MSDLAIGLMSGTSLDGIDAALVRIESAQHLDLVAFHTQPYAAADRAAIDRVLASGSVRDVALLHVQLGKRLAEAVEMLLQRAGVPGAAVGLVACHGQTVWHEPGTATLQLGDPAVIAERIGVPVVSDFRSRDVAAGGQGAPLVSLADVMLFAHPEHGRALLNVGGMANVTWVPRRGVRDAARAFDTGPGVAVVDAVTRQVDPTVPYDIDGRLAAQGRACSEVVDDLLEHPFFAAPPPKSTGREVFGEAYATDLMRRVRQTCSRASDADCVATAVELTVRSIATQIARWIAPAEHRDLVVSGGGARNPELLRGLRAALGGWELRLFDEEFFDGDAKEAVAFAYLGWCTQRGLPGNVPEATGATGLRVLGRVTPV